MSDRPLSAAQGVKLKQLIDDTQADIDLKVQEAVESVEEQIPLVLPYTFEWGDTEKVAVDADNTVYAEHFNRTPKDGDIFLFGSKSDFNDLSWEIVTTLKKDYPYLKRIYVRSAFQYIDKSYEEYLAKYYEDTYFPKKIENAGKFSYVERNYEMIDNSTYCVFYYNENYIPPTKRNSGTNIAYNYAKKKKKEIINLFN